MIRSHSPGSRNNFRFYIVMITLVVCGIFVLLFLNNDQGEFSITNAIVGNSINNTFEEDQIAEENLEISFEDLFPEENVEERAPQKQREVEIKLNFDKVPTFEEEAKIKKMELHFDDLTTTITVNGDKLELNSLKEVNFIIEEFDGIIDFTENGLSLIGAIKRLAVNKMALSSEEEMIISFDNLNYHFLNIEGISLQNVKLEAGNGQLGIGQRLQYTLDSDSVYFNSFEGELTTNKKGNTTLVLNGISEGVRISGEFLDISVR